MGLLTPRFSARPVALGLILTLGASACAAGAASESAPEAAVAPSESTAIVVANRDQASNDDDVVVDAAVAATSFSLIVDPNGAILRGQVPDDAARNLLVEAAKADFIGATIVDELDIAEVPLSADARTNIEAAIELIRPVSANLRIGELQLNGAKLRIVGSAYDRPAAVAINLRLLDSAIENELSVSIPEPGTETAIQTAINQLDLQSIQFDRGTSDLTETAGAVLVDVAALLADNPRVEVQVEGHTDGNGSAEANLRLSQDRAEEVVDALGELGVDIGRLSAQGFGLERPIADNATEDGRIQNRRVELIVQAS